MQHERALLVFAKHPEPERVKTRLHAQLQPAEAARLYQAFLTDALAQYVRLGVAVRLYLDPPLRTLPPGIIPPGVAVFPQEGMGLGARMLHAFLHAFQDGFQHLVIIGTDHPTLPTAFVQQAFVSLEPRKRICIGPSQDGGYYLLGMNSFYPEVFADMQYSHANVFEQTLDRALETDATVTQLPAWYDVDTPDELVHLVEELRGDDTQAPETAAVLRDMGLL